MLLVLINGRLIKIFLKWFGENLGHPCGLSFSITIHALTFHEDILAV